MSGAVCWGRLLSGGGWVWHSGEAEAETTTHLPEAEMWPEVAPPRSEAASEVRSLPEIRSLPAIRSLEGGKKRFTGLSTVGADTSPIYKAVGEVPESMRALLTTEEWERVRLVTEADLRVCVLKYVEVGAVISRFVQCPFGTINARSALCSALNVKRWKRQYDHWVTGCLLRRADVQLRKLLEFCVRTLHYTPRKPWSLECLTDRSSRCHRCPWPHTEQAVRELILQLERDYEDTLSDPLTIADFAQLEFRRSTKKPPLPYSKDQPSKNQRSKDKGSDERSEKQARLEPIEEEPLSQPFRPLPQPGSPLTSLSGGPAESSEPRAEPKADVNGADNNRGVLRSPLRPDTWVREQKRGKSFRRAQGRFRVFAAQRRDLLSNAAKKVSALLGDNWEQLEDMEAKDLTACSPAYVELGTIIDKYIRDAFGTVSKFDVAVVAAAMTTGEGRILPPLSLVHGWITGCILQYAQVPQSQLITFCTEDLRYIPSTRFLLDCLRARPETYWDYTRRTRAGKKKREPANYLAALLSSYQCKVTISKFVELFHRERNAMSDELETIASQKRKRGRQPKEGQRRRKGRQPTEGQQSIEDQQPREGQQPIEGQRPGKGEQRRNGQRRNGQQRRKEQQPIEDQQPREGVQLKGRHGPEPPAGTRPDDPFMYCHPDDLTDFLHWVESGQA
ncbi:hypothetical protein GNI_177460 [Gregarina niphandrodes]|uniref:Uncharacterized protein n=1 Tax=Gregarina niphandrodes TaxID=110365 RepID=A0A023AX62_GRENI|nr:hypothetical protein GNI_177460 [Gregarina niphandrodes]EZG43299.1 hypothetical protein GNI_177460 [Gregarina niphandrodes]|eukprot:XP_011133441.1 hypothetical protein GNI_177460 [Gregarina niphandrodes]